jgi:hypothetical protein
MAPFLGEPCAVQGALEGGPWDEAHNNVFPFRNLRRALQMPSGVLSLVAILAAGGAPGAWLSMPTVS